MRIENINHDVFSSRNDYLYHFGIDCQNDDIEQFRDVKFLIITELDETAAHIASYFIKKWYEIDGDNVSAVPLFKTERFHLFKVGPLLISSSGVGGASLLICINELTKLFIHLKKEDVAYINLGAAEGIGVNHGEILVATEVVNSGLSQAHNNTECGVDREYSTVFDCDFGNKFIQFCKDQALPVTTGKIMTFTDVYLECGLLQDMCQLPFSTNEYDHYLQKCYDFGIRAVDNYATTFAAFCTHLGINCLNIRQISLNLLEMMPAKQQSTITDLTIINLVTQFIIVQLRNESTNGN